MSTYTPDADSIPGGGFVQGMDTPGQWASYLSGRHGAVWTVVLNTAAHSLGKDPVEPYPFIKQCGVLEVSAAAPYTLTHIPTIEPGRKGQLLHALFGGSNNITLQDDSVLSGSGLFLATPTFVGIPGSSITFVYSAAKSGWVEVARWSPNRTGIYLPLHTLVANLTASTRYNCQWARLAGTVNMVHVTGKADLDATNTGVLTRLGVQLPIASVLTAPEQCAGTCNSGAVGGSAGVVLGDVTNGRAEINVVPTDVANDSYYFSFMYPVF